MEQEPTPLSSAEKKELRGIAQRLKPHVHIGKNGLSETVTKEIEMALTKNGLIKIRFEGDKASMKQFQSEIAENNHCEYIGGVGKVGIFYRDMPVEEKI
ncbi:MAG: YhbY family RNA-binding protein [Opitutaceae bacterium]